MNDRRIARDLRVIFVSRVRSPCVPPFFVSWSVNGKWFIFSWLKGNGKTKMPRRRTWMRETLSWSKDEWLFPLIKAQKPSLQKRSGVTFHHSRTGNDIRDDFEINWKSIIILFYIELCPIVLRAKTRQVNRPREKIVTMTYLICRSVRSFPRNSLIIEVSDFLNRQAASCKSTGIFS